MKIISFETCRITSLFPFEEVVPLGGVNDRELVERVKDRYKFLKSPDLTIPNEERAKAGYVFESGQFTIGSSIARIFDLSVYRDGIVINAVTTEQAEAFLDDVIGYMRDEFAFRDFTRKPPRFFQSQIVVQFEKSPGRLVQFLGRITGAISQKLNPIYGMEIPIQFARIDFGFDKMMPGAPRTAVHPFVVERREGVSFDNERYFCAAPLRTSDHVALLKEIEALL